MYCVYCVYVVYCVHCDVPRTRIYTARDIRGTPYNTEQTPKLPPVSLHGGNCDGVGTDREGQGGETRTGSETRPDKAKEHQDDTSDMRQRERQQSGQRQSTAMTAGMGGMM